MVRIFFAGDDGHVRTASPLQPPGAKIVDSVPSGKPGCCVFTYRYIFGRVMEIRFSLEAWEQYTSWQTRDKKTMKRINELLKDIVRGNYFEGIGKPEPLKGNLSGFWSRRIDEHNRLVYRIQGEQGAVCQVAQCKEQ